MKFCSSFNSTKYLNEIETYKTNTDLFININKILQPLYHEHDTKRNPWVVFYTHIAQLMTHTTYVHSCCLPCNYVTKPFGILQTVIKSQRVYLYHLDSAKVDIFSLRKVKAAKFSENFIFKFSSLMKRYKKFRSYQCAAFKKEMFLLCPYEEMYSHFKLLVETFSYFVR